MHHGHLHPSKITTQERCNPAALNNSGPISSMVLCSPCPKRPKSHTKSRIVFFEGGCSPATSLSLPPRILQKISSVSDSVLHHQQCNPAQAAQRAGHLLRDDMRLHHPRVLLGTRKRGRREDTTALVGVVVRWHANSKHLSRVHAPLPTMVNARLAACALRREIISFIFSLVDLILCITLFISVKNDRGPRWVQDKAVFWCKGCNTDFSFLVRKHHCRHCGHVFCAHCCSNRRAIVKYGYGEPVRPQVLITFCFYLNMRREDPPLVFVERWGAPAHTF